MKSLIKEIYADYIMTGYRSGDCKFKTSDAPWVFSGIITIQVSSLLILVLKILDLFNTDFVLPIYIVTTIVSLVLNYSFKNLYLRECQKLKKEKKLVRKKIYQNKFFIMFFLTMFSFALVLFYALR